MAIEQAFKPQMARIQVAFETSVLKYKAADYPHILIYRIFKNPESKTFLLRSISMSVAAIGMLFLGIEISSPSDAIGFAEFHYSLKEFWLVYFSIFLITLIFDYLSARQTYFFTRLMSEEESISNRVLILFSEFGCTFFLCVVSLFFSIIYASYIFSLELSFSTDAQFQIINLEEPEAEVTLPGEYTVLGRFRNSSIHHGDFLTDEHRKWRIEESPFFDGLFNTQSVTGENNFYTHHYFENEKIESQIRDQLNNNRIFEIKIKSTDCGIEKNEDKFCFRILASPKKITFFKIDLLKISWIEAYKRAMDTLIGIFQTTTPINIETVSLTRVYDLGVGKDHKDRSFSEDVTYWAFVLPAYQRNEMSTLHLSSFFGQHSH